MNNSNITRVNEIPQVNNNNPINSSQQVNQVNNNINSLSNLVSHPNLSTPSPINTNIPLTSKSNQTTMIKTSSSNMIKSNNETNIDSNKIDKNSINDDSNIDNTVFNGDVNTKIACLNCREKKLKCDKLLPVCTRCAKKKCPCIYVEHKKTGPKPNSGSNKVKKNTINKSKSIKDLKNRKQKINYNSTSTSISTSSPASDQHQTSYSTPNSLPLPPLPFMHSLHTLPPLQQAIPINQHLNISPNPTPNLSPNPNLTSNQYQQFSYQHQQLPYQYADPSSARISVDNFMNPLSFNHPLVQNSTTNLRESSISNINLNKENKLNNIEHNETINKTENNTNINENNKIDIQPTQSTQLSTYNKTSISSVTPISTTNNTANNTKTTKNIISNSLTISDKSKYVNKEKLNKTITSPSTNYKSILDKRENSNPSSNEIKNLISTNTTTNQNSSNNQIIELKQKTKETTPTNLTNLTNKSFEEIIGLPELNLTMQDIDKFHSFYFNSNTRIFKYSVQRYYNTFVKEPKSILHYSYMIWTIACFYLDEYEHIVEKMYKTALVQMTNYWESNRDSFHSDILTYLHALCLKSQFEFLSGREMRAALTVSSSIRLTQMYGYDQIDLSPTTLGTPAIFFRSFSVNSDQFESANTLLQDDNLDPEIPLVEERRRVLWEVFAIDKWSSLVTGLPCALSVDSLSVIFTKLPSPTTFLPLNNDSDITETENEQSSYYLHEAMQKLDNNQVLLDINSSSSKILLLTISENIIKWCKMFLNMVELETLKNPTSIDSIRHKVDELVRNFESMHNNLLFFDLTTEPLMNIVITNTSTLLYQSVLIKFSSLFDIQLKEDPTGSNICENEINLFKDILFQVSSMSEQLVSRFIKKQHIEIHLKKAPVFIVFINSIKSLFQCIAFVYRFNKLLNINEERKNSLIETINSCRTIINSMSVKTPLVEKTKNIINNGQELLDHSPQSLSFFDSFFDSAKTY